MSGPDERKLDPTEELQSTVIEPDAAEINVLSVVVECDEPPTSS